MRIERRTVRGQRVRVAGECSGAPRPVLLSASIELYSYKLYLLEMNVLECPVRSRALILYR